MQDRKIFIDTHVHTVHSELDGMCKLEEYIEYGKQNNFPALFISDHGNISGWIPFYLGCKEAGMKPVLGSEFYISEGLTQESTETDKQIKLEKENKLNFHLCLYAKNLTGYKNIIKLTTYANLENFYKRPRITFDVLKKYSEGIICTTACVGSIFAYYILKDEVEKAVDYIKLLQDLFKDDFYIEYGYHNFNSEEKYITSLRRIAKDLQIKEIVANDTHYLYKEDETAHKILMCKGSQTVLDKSDFDYSQNYYKSYTEICEAFNKFGWFNLDKFMANTYEIISKIDNYDIPLGKYVVPELKDTHGLTQSEFLLEQVKKGLKKRFGDIISPEVKERVKYELSVVNKMNFSGYFNVVADYINWAKNNDIPVGPARGSGAGSMLNYLIGITNVNPLEYNLLFERFLNPDRSGYPDVDSDLEPSGRAVLLTHLTKQYGQKGCIPISTRGYLKGKSSIKAVSSKLGLDFNKYNRLLSSIKDPSIDTVQKVIDSSDELTKLYKTDSEFKKVIDIAKKLEGSIQSISVHASAVCLELKDISDYVPIIRTKDGYATGWTDKIVEKCGLIKYDILGLSNLSIIDKCCKLIGDDFDINSIPLDDKKTFKDLQDGDNLGKFQIESQGMKSLLKRLQPECIEHISSVLALFRPGAMQFIDQYIENKKHPENIQYFDKRVKPVLAKTYGQIVYQEQVMQIARILAGYTMAEADILRKAISKKVLKDMLEQEEKFTTGCIQNGILQDKAKELFDQIVEFARYSFNASHSVAYSFITYQTAYLKSNYTPQYMTALLSCNTDNLEKLNLYINDCYRLGLPVLPPDINESGKDFTLTDNNEIRFGLSAIKGLGNSAITDIINARQHGNFKSVENFIERTKKVDKSAIQTLLKVGAFDRLEDKTERWCKMLDYLNDAKNSKAYAETADIENSIYTVLGAKRGKKTDEYKKLADLKRGLGGSKFNIAKRKEYTEQQERVLEESIKVVQKYFLQFTKFKTRERMQFEQELLGFNITTNPYKRWSTFKKFFISQNGENLPYIELNDLMSNSDKYFDLDKFYTVGILSDIKEIKTKRGQKMAKLTVEYYGAKAVITVFSNKWENNIEFKIQKGNMVCVTGDLVEANKKYSDTDYEIRLDTIQQLNVLMNEQNKCIINIDGKDRRKIDYLVKTFASQERKSNMPVEKCVMYKTGGKYIILNGLCWINNPNKLLEQINT